MIAGTGEVTTSLAGFRLPVRADIWLNERLSFAPDPPTVAETVPEFEVTAWEGILAPAGTPKAVVVKISEEMQRIGKDPEFIKSMLEVRAIVRTTSPDEFASFIAGDYTKWRQVISKVGIKVE